MYAFHATALQPLLEYAFDTPHALHPSIHSFFQIRDGPNQVQSV